MLGYVVHFWTFTPGPSMNDAMTLHKLFGIAPSLNARDAANVLKIINALEAQLDEAHRALADRAPLTAPSSDTASEAMQDELHPSLHLHAP